MKKILWIVSMVPLVTGSVLADELDSSVGRSTATFAELSRINSQTKLVEARVKLNEAMMRLNSGSTAGKAALIDPNPAINEAASLVEVVAVVGSDSAAQGVLRLSTGALLRVRVGSFIAGLGQVTAINYVDGVKVGEMCLPFENENPRLSTAGREGSNRLTSGKP